MTVCGTGNWTGPKPGDPDSNVLLSATSVFGGVKVSWTMPELFPYAVAHVRIYRSNELNYASSVEIATVNANTYIDINEYGSEKQYYYWITVVSVNGTDSPLIGPASALSRPHIEDMIELLTGKIEHGALSLALKNEIGNISLLGTSITDEVAARIAANAALGLTIAGLDGELVNALTILESEVNARISADSSIITSLDLMAVGFDESIAGLTEEITLQAGPDSTLARKITTLEATVDGDSVTGQIGLTAAVDSVTDTVAGLYTAKIDVNGLVGGFGLSNDGTTVEAGFDVERFWVGRSALDPVTGSVAQVKPFIIEGTEVFVNEAVINKLTFNKLSDETGSLVAEKGVMRFVDTGGIVVGTMTWDPTNGVYTDGYGVSLTGKGIMAHDGTKTTFAVDAATGSVTFGGALDAASGSFAGALSAATGTFSGSLDAATGSFAGSLSAATGTFSGSLTASAINAVNTINIGLNQVTVPEGGTLASAMVIPDNGLWNVVLGVTVDALGQKIWVHATASGTYYSISNGEPPSTDYFYSSLALFVDGVQQGAAGMGGYMYSILLSGGGARLIQLKAKAFTNNGAVITVGSATLFAIGAKR